MKNNQILKITMMNKILLLKIIVQVKTMKRKLRMMINNNNKSNKKNKEKKDLKFGTILVKQNNLILYNVV